MITLIYPYRNRSIGRVRNSLESLTGQSNKDFQVEFIDYGSEPSLAAEVKELVTSYSFSNYTYSNTQYQLWNKSRALNIIIKNLHTDYCFVSDVDMIFAPNFIETLHKVKNPNAATYFQVGYLSKEESEKNVPFKEYKTKFLSTSEATGLTLFPTSKLKELNGFDEFFHLWGAEDTDMHHRLRNNGVQIKYFDNDLLMVHQWHISFVGKKKKDYTRDFVLTDIELLNHEHKDKNHNMKVTQVNPDGWGKRVTKSEFMELNDHPIGVFLTNQTKDVNHLLHSLLPSKSVNVLSVEINDSKEFSMKRSLKKFLGKRVNLFYSMKKVNDLVLMQLIAHYRNKNYIYQVSENAEKITLKIKL